MADVQVTLNVQSEIKGFCDPLIQLAKDIKAKNPSASLIADGSQILLALLTGYAAYSADLKTAETQAYLGYVLGQIGSVFSGAV